MTHRFALLALSLLAAAGAAEAANPHVWFDTDRGPLVIELDPARAPNTSANFKRYVDDGFYNGLVFHRVINNFVVQAGAVTASGSNRLPTYPTIPSERNNGLKNVPGTISMALSGSNVNSGQAQFFINTATNAHLDADFTVFGRVVFGQATLQDIGSSITYANEMPFRPPLIKRAFSADGFPIMPLHTGSWFDPAKSGRGISLEISNVAGSEEGPLMVAYWYDYFEGRQVWMNGAARFSYGATEVTLPLLISQGGQFGAAFDPASVSFDQAFGSLTVRFDDCDSGTFSYQTKYGNGQLPMVRITLPDGQRCAGQ